MRVRRFRIKKLCGEPTMNHGPLPFPGKNPGLYIVEETAQQRVVHGLLKSQRKVLAALRELCEESPPEMLRLALGSDDVFRIRRKCNQREVYDFADGRINFNAKVSEWREELDKLCRLGFLSKHNTRPAIEGRITEHVVYQLTSLGTQAALHDRKEN